MEVLRRPPGPRADYDRRVTTPSEPGERRPADTPRAPLERPPGERYRPTGTDADAQPSASLARAVAQGSLVALVGAAVLVLLGGPLSMSVGLLVVAGAIGWLLGQVVSVAAGPRTSPRTRRSVAAVLALDSVVLGQVGLWLFAASQGGALGLVDYLVQARGLVVPLELAIAVLIAWWTTR